MKPDHADRRTQQGLAMIALLAIVLVVAVIGIAMVGFMNSDITLAGIQGDVSRAHYAADAGVQAAMQRLSSDPSFASEPCPPSGSSWPGTGRIDVGPRAGTFSYCAAPWGADPAAAIYLVVSEGQYGRYSRRVGALASYGAGMSGVFGRNGILLEGAGGAPARTYLAPLTVLGSPCVPSTPPPGGDMGSLGTINFQDPGIRVNALTGFDLPLQGVGRSVPDYELFGFCSMPAFDPNSPTMPPTLAGRFGAIVQGAPVGSTDFADLTIRNDATNRCPDSVYSCDISVLRAPVPQGGANMTDVYMSQIQKQIMAVPSIDRETLRSEAAANRANAPINRALGFGHDNSVYTASQFQRILSQVRSNCDTVLLGPVFVTGNVDISDEACSGVPGRRTELVIRPVDAGTPAFLAVENGTLTLRNQARLSVGDIPFNAASFPIQLARGGVFTFSSPGPTGDSNGRIVLETSSRFRVIGLSYTDNGTTIGQTVMYDLVGLTHNRARITDSCWQPGGRPRRIPCSFESNNGTVVVRYDARAAGRLAGRGGALGILSWWQGP